MQSWLSGVVLAENVGLGALHSTMFLAKLCGLWTVDWDEAGCKNNVFTLYSHTGTAYWTLLA